MEGVRKRRVKRGGEKKRRDRDARRQKEGPGRHEGNERRGEELKERRGRINKGICRHIEAISSAPPHTHTPHARASSGGDVVPSRARRRGRGTQALAFLTILADKLVVK